MCRTPVARVMTGATVGATGATYPQGSQASECNSLATSPYILNFGSLSHPHGLEEAPVVHQPLIHGWTTLTYLLVVIPFPYTYN